MARITSSSTSIDRRAKLGRVSASMWGSEPADLWSAPDENPRPAPVSTTARTSLSWVSSSSTFFNGTMTSNAIEFIRSGRFRVTNATCGRGRSTRTKEFCSVTRCTLSRAPSRLLLLGATLSGDRGVHVELLDLVDQLVELSRGQHARMPEHHVTLL